MDLDQQLSQPLAPVRDDGFSVMIMRRVRASQQRMKLVMWLLLAVGFAPAAAALHAVDTGIRLPPGTVQWINSQLAYPVGVLVLLLVWKPRLFLR